MILRPLTAIDAPLVAAMTVAMIPLDWEKVVQELVRERVPDALSLGSVSALGAFENDDLVGVSAWCAVTDRTDAWRCVLLAVRLGRQNHGIATCLKRELIERARASGVTFVVSTVHGDNRAMLKLNRRFGAHIIPSPDDHTRSYFECVVMI